MRVLERLCVFLMLMVFSVNFLLPLCAQGAYVVQKATLTVYRDGVVHVNIVLLVDEYEPLIVVPLLSPMERVSGIIVLGENDSLLDYDLSGNNITIYSLGSAKITLEYSTDGLTHKAFGLWTINFTAPFELTLILPENATIMYLSGVPSAIRVVESRLEMDLSPGDWEIKYELPIQLPMPPSSRPPSQQQPSITRILPIEYMIITIVTICAIATTIVYLKRRRVKEALSDEEAEIIRFIRRRGGRVLEAELRENFPHIPRTSMWRLIKRLEKEGVVRVRKVGLQNVVELK